jgi:hypothetical protein
VVAALLVVVWPWSSELCDDSRTCQYAGDDFRAAVMVCCFIPYDRFVAVGLCRMQLLPKHLAKLIACCDERRCLIELIERNLAGKNTQLKGTSVNNIAK